MRSSSTRLRKKKYFNRYVHCTKEKLEPTSELDPVNALSMQKMIRMKSIFFIFYLKYKSEFCDKHDFANNRKQKTRRI